MAQNERSTLDGYRGGAADAHFQAVRTHVDAPCIRETRAGTGRRDADDVLEPSFWVDGSPPIDALLGWTTGPGIGAC